MWQPRCALCTALILVGLLGGANANENCGPGLETPGVTIPRGDIVIMVGKPLEIFCVLHPSQPEGRTSSHLVFYHNDRQVPSEYITVVNETTIRLYIESPPPMKSMYYCKLQSNAASGMTEESVCLNTVFVGTLPEDVTNFACVSHNWENLTCSWKVPQNYVKTKYKLRYKLPGRAGGRVAYNCPNNLDEDESKCFWDPSTDPHYRQPYEYYYFTMTGENVLGNVTFSTRKFHHYSHVIPTAPLNLSQVNQTLNSVYLEWTIPYPMQIFPPGVTFWVRYQSEWDSRDHWVDVNTAHMSTKSISPNQTRFLNVTDLKYSNALYDIKVSMKSAIATKGSDMWSIPANLTFKTLPTIPGSAPKTDIGSFEVSGGLRYRDIYVYWQHIPETIKNGENFEYKVYKMEDGEKKYMEPHESTKAYAKFKQLDFGGHRFIIHSANKEGLSQDHSIVYVPPYRESPPEPGSFTKVAFGNGTFELSWRAPRNYSIDNYTIFWCENDRDRPYQCSGLLNWTHIEGDKTVTRVQVVEHKVYQFAISANAKIGSSGMVWSTCTVIHDRVVGKMKNVWFNDIRARVIDVGWKLECSDRVGMVTGFRITYCPIWGPHNNNCKEPVQNVTVNGDSSTISGRINGLKPYTTYQVSVAVVTKNGVGLMSEPLYNTTYEASPDTPPFNISVTNITNSSMLVSWVLPNQTNGLIRDVFVYYNERKEKVLGKENKVILEKLDSYVKYNISVKACTVSCSDRSPVISRRTLVGVPSRMDAPRAEIVNNSELSVSWNEPKFAAGDLDLYQVLVAQIDSTTNHSKNIHNVTTGNSTLIKIDDCSEKSSSGYVYKVNVRAVNKDEQHHEYIGPWSEPVERNCRSPYVGPTLTVLYYVVGFLLLTGFILLSAYCLKRGWQRCKVMQDVEVKLPPGLAPLSEKDPHITVHSWPMSEVRDPHKARPSADEEHLLQKKEDRERHGRNPSGDSSGCSSGHESVSSSITSATHMSSDSGTGQDQDQRAGSPDGVFSESPAWECGSLDQAPVDPDPYVRMGKISSGSVARSTPNLSDLVEPGAYLGTWSSTGYISMPSSEDMGVASSSYVRVGQNPPAAANAGYITIASVQPPTPSYRPKAYVAIPAPRSEADSYCRMGLPVAKIATGYVALADASAANGNYVPHSDHNSVTSV